MDRGAEFIRMINQQNTIQWSIVSRLSELIRADWDSDDLKAQLDDLVRNHTSITVRLNELDSDVS